MSLQDRDLQEKNEDRIDSLYTLFEAVNDRLKALEEGEGAQQSGPAEVAHLMDRVDALEEQLDSLQAEMHDDSKEAKVAAIVEAAQNGADAQQKGAVMNYKQIMRATGVSDTMAYKYIDRLPDQYPFLRDRHDVPSNVDEDTLAKDKGLLVDFEEVERMTGPCNRLLHGSEQKGGSK